MHRKMTNNFPENFKPRYLVGGALRYWAVRYGAAPVIASLGRSGSTMLTESCARSLLPSRILCKSEIIRNSLIRNAWTFTDAEFHKGFVYKTHDYPPASQLPDHVRIIYLYADPIEVVVSILQQYRKYGPEWIEEHADHMKVNNINIRKICEDDIFRLEDHFDKWIGASGIPLLAIRYDKIWEYKSLISQFFGVPIELPPFQKRNASFNVLSKTDQEIALNTYGNLCNKISNLPMHLSNTAQRILR